MLNTLSRILSRPGSANSSAADTASKSQGKKPDGQPSATPGSVAPEIARLAASSTPATPHGTSQSRKTVTFAVSPTDGQGSKSATDAHGSARQPPKLLDKALPALPGSAAAPGNTTEAKLKAPAKALPSSPDAADKAAKQDTEKHADVQSPLAKVESSSSQPIASSSKVKLEDLPKTPQETPPETLAETSAETPPDTQAVEDPGFKMPARAQRFGQPVDRDKPGFSLLETNKLRPGASMAAAVGISTHTTVGAADAALVGGSVTAAHESLGAVINGHAFLAATQRKKRYGAQLDSMLKDDLGKLDENRRNGVAMPPETMIFKRKNGIRKLEDVYDPKAAKRDGKRRDDGKTAAASSAKPIELEYDMEAVKRLAASDDPKLKNESAHAKNVLLTAYLKDDVAAKQGNRAAYEFIRNTVAISAATATAVGTHGAAVAVAGTHAAHVAAGTRIAGSAISGASSLDVAKGIRGLKQRMRNDKAEVVDSYALQRRQAFAEEYAGPKATPEKKAVMSKLEESGDKEKVVKDTHRAFLEQARVQAGKETFGRVFKGSSIDDTRSTTAKKEMRDVVGKHAYTVVNYHMGLSDPKKSEHLAGEWDKIMKTPNSTRKSRQKQFADLFDKDPGTKTAYHLLRDTGMGRGESIYTMQRMIEMSIETKMAADPEMAAVGGSADFAKDDAAQKATTSRLTTAMGRR